jgi:hypothetical protein
LHSQNIGTPLQANIPDYMEKAGNWRLCSLWNFLVIRASNVMFDAEIRNGQYTLRACPGDLPFTCLESH